MLVAGAPRALAPSEVESDGGGAPASASCCRCATCRPRTSPTLAPLLFHRCCMGPMLAVRGEVPQDESQSPSPLKHIGFYFTGRVSAALGARACPPDRPSRWISLTALVSLCAGRRNWMAVGRPAHSVPRAVRHPSSPPPRRSAPVRALLREVEAPFTPRSSVLSILWCVLC